MKQSISMLGSAWRTNVFYLDDMPAEFALVVPRWGVPSAPMAARDSGGCGLRVAAGSERDADRTASRMLCLSVRNGARGRTRQTGRCPLPFGVSVAVTTAQD